MMPVTSGLVILEVGRLKDGKLHDQQYRLSDLREVLLVNGGLVEGAEDLIEEAESALSPDNESAKVTTGGKLEKVQSANVDNLNARKVPERLDDAVVFIVNDEGSATLAVPATSDLSFSSTSFPRVRDLGDIGVGVNRLKNGDGFLGLGQRLHTRGNNKGDLLSSLDSVAASEDKGRKGRSCQGRDNSKSALALVNFDMPLAPSFCRGEHATTAAHVAKGGLMGS